MGTTNFNSSAAASALQKMANAAEGLQNNAKSYMTTLENDVYANLSGPAVSNFLNQSNTHCQNLGIIAKNISEITSTLSSVANYHAEKDQMISRQ